MGKKLHRATIRLDNGLHMTISTLAELADVSKSEVIRQAILFSRVIHDPSLRLRDALKESAVELLRRDPELVLDMPLIDVLKPLRKLVEQVRPPEMYLPERKESS